MYGAILVPPAADAADIGVFFIDNGGYKDLCGHGTMGVVTALVETGYLDPDGAVTVETPAGLVTADPEISDAGRVEHVTVEAGAQAIVGDVHHHQPHQKPKDHARVATARPRRGKALPGPHPIDPTVSGAGDEERPLQDARRPKHGGADR